MPSQRGNNGPAADNRRACQTDPPSPPRSAVPLVFVGQKTAFGWLGLIPLITRLLGYCPAYALFGLRTCR